ncbi:MAG: L-serine ammonia-lyase, iron-sulfur-dependent, subunit alpha [Clostridia bacterium]|nr:L-serine ammonia-lyase, iron-sulfur-dependent, subunit alpha [Clostridia bacterium]
MFSVEFSEKIRFLRKKNRLSQEELGRKVGVSNRAVSKWENGQSLPSTDTLLSVATVLGVTLDYFLKNEIATARERRIEEGMESLRELYKIGKGPSSSHTMGPAKAAQLFRRKHPEATLFRAVLFGSLAKTGAELSLDACLEESFHPIPVTVAYDRERLALPHPNTMQLEAWEGHRLLERWEIYSVGGGSIVIAGHPVFKPRRIYPHNSFRDIASYCKAHGLRLWQYAERYEGREIWDYLSAMWDAAESAIEAGLSAEGELFGGLGVQRRAKKLCSLRHPDENAQTRENRLVSAYAFAVSEHNAAGGTIVTAPTCGACGIVPAVLKYVTEEKGLSRTALLRAMATAGLVGNIIKTRASISGAECGCQAEVGSACAMAAAAVGELHGYDLDQIEYAAEVALEHHLGLTCDPVRGLVQIPCIERNAVAAMRAIHAASLAGFLADSRKIPFDSVVETMYQTGRDMPRRYRETGEAGLATLYDSNERIPL